jgi:hypothetical protein
VTKEPIFYEEESLTLHSELFDKYLNKLVFEQINSKGKRFQGKDTYMYLNGVPTLRIVEEDQLEVVGTSRATTTKDDTKGTYTRK